jgi:hypothetical protein
MKKVFSFFKKYGKKIAKYVLNTINFVNAILLVLDPIWNIPMVDKISATLVGIAGVISAYLLGNKGVQKLKKDGESYE